MSEVISLNKKREEKQQTVTVDETHPKPAENFAETMRRNAENAARIKKEREKANKGVIRSYRLKH